MSDTSASLPPVFVDRSRRLLGAEADGFLSSIASPAAGLRVNTLRLTPARFGEISPFSIAPLAYPPEGFTVDGEARPGKHPYHAAGLYYLQDPGAMTVGALLDPRPGERVLDLAAAPGGKATHIAARMSNRGLLVANDVHAGRARELAGNLERCGATNALVTSESVDRLARHFGAYFDRVLLDAPCSGESMFHKSAAARAEWSEGAVAGCARRQGDLLGEAAACVRPGGLLVYSTCTFSPEENERVVADFLDAHPDFEVAPLAAVPGGVPARPEWAGDAARAAELAGALRLWPHLVAGAGHFVAGLRRVGGEEGSPGDFRGEPRPKEARELAASLLAALAGDGGDAGGPLWMRGSEMYRLPAAVPDLGGLRVERPGLWVGSVQKGRIDPAHALAMGLETAAVRRVVALAVGDPEVRAFLRGETFENEGDPGWALVTADGFPLGWGKRVGRIVKNHLPKGLRQR